MKVCRGNAQSNAKAHWRCRRIYLERAGKAIKESKMELEAMAPWEKLVTMQDILSREMGLARAGIELGDDGGERRMVAKQKLTARKAGQKNVVPVEATSS